MRIGIALAAALTLALAPMAGANAQERSDRAAAGELAKLRERGMKEAPALVQAAGYPCTVTDAIFLGESPAVDAEGKPVKGPGRPIYEVACQEGLGFMFGNPEPAPLDCLKLSTSVARQKAAGQKVTVSACRLPANGDGQQGVFALAQKVGLTCTPTRARWVGTSATAKTEIYEVGCSDNSSSLIITPQAGSTAKPAVESCLPGALRGDSTCEYLPKETAMAAVGQLAAKSGKACQMKDARWVGNKTAGGAWYEVACADGKGFMVETAPNGAYANARDCAQAENVGGGCTLTQMSSAGDTQDLPIYTRKMKEIGHPCVPSKYRSLGSAPDGTDRELVELACSNQAEGLFAAIALSASGKNETYNCARAEARAQICRLSDKKATFPQLSDRMKAKGATCNVRDSRGVGQAAGNQDVIEVACDGGPGYMLIFIGGSEAIGQVIPCASPQAAGIGGGCKLK